MFKKKNKSSETMPVEQVTFENGGEAQYTVEKKQPKKPIKHKKLLVVIFIVVVLAIVGVLASHFFGGAADLGNIVSVGNAEISDLETSVTIKGTVVGSDSADVYSAANYRITEILVKEGDYVKKGQILAKLDASDLQDQYNVSKIAYNDAKRAYDNAKALYAEGAISKTDYDAADSAYKTAKLNLSAYDIVEKSNVTSPIDGTVTRVNCTVGRIAGDTTNNKGAMFVIENVENLKMQVKVGEFDIADIRVGQEVEISADILGKQKVTGVVSQIAPTGEDKGDGTGMVIPVTIDIDKGDTNLIAGVTAKAVIKTASRADVMTVPVDSLLEDPDTGENFVFIVNDDNTVKKVPVELGLEGDFSVEITKGEIKDGDTLVLSPELSLEDGATVVVMPQ